MEWMVCAGASLGSPEEALRDELKYFRFLSQMILAPHISVIEQEVRLIYEKWGSDGHKLVHCAINANPALSKQDRADLLDAAVTLFSRGSATGPYNMVACEDFKNVADSHVDVAAAAIRVAKPKTRMFWG